MNQFCIICNTRPKVTDRTNIFTQYTSQNKLLVDVLSEILDKPLPKEVIHSSILCKKCHNNCVQYEGLDARLKELQTSIQKQFKNSLQRLNLDSETFALPGKIQIKLDENIPKKAGKTLVVPASKLQPLPPDFVMNVKNLPIVSNSNVWSNISQTAKSTPTILNTNRTVNVAIPKINLQQKSQSITDKVIDANITNAISSILNTKTSASIMTVNNSVPKDFLSNNTEKMKVENDESMEIDEECTLVRITNEDNQAEDEAKDVKEQYFDVSLVPISEASRDGADEGDDADDGDGGDNGDYEQTIVMSGDNASILRVMSGQKLVYEGAEIALVADDDASNQGDDNNDGHDSNEESQIELQVSGDEETANAIIAAAQEQGGAFIKVESGEMFRVKSVKSQKNTSPVSSDTNTISKPMVEKIGDLYKCLICEDTNKEPLSFSQTRFLKPETLRQHMRHSHRVTLYMCDHCHRVSNTRADHNAHILEHVAKGDKGATTPEKSKMHECNICKKRYNSRTLLTEHMNIHNGTRPYVCAQCHKTFASKYTYQAHVKIHLERPRPFKCKQCGKSFLTQANLTQHEKTHSGIKEFVCNICGKAFGTQHNLEVHGVVHSGSRPFVCGLCGKGFARRAEVRDHMRTHTGERPFACEVCGAQFAQRSNLHSHKRATHLDDKRYQCDLCTKKFKRRRLLEYHIKASHTGERPLECATCHATFVYPEHYKKHLRIHSGERPYVCEVCGKSFNSRDNRNTHRFVHSDKKPYECLVCGAGYMRKQLLYAHMNSSGHMAESIVVNQPRMQKMEETVIPTETLEDELANTETVQVFASTEELEISEDKSVAVKSINLVQENAEPTLLTLQNVEDNVKNESGAFLQSVTVDQADGDGQVMLESSSGDVVRLVQIHLQNGTSGWMYIGQ